MEAKTGSSKHEVKKSSWLLSILPSAALILISNASKAVDSVAAQVMTPDSLAADTMNPMNKPKGLRALDEGGVLTYVLIVVGIIVIIGFAFLTSMRKNKPTPGAPVGYRKPHHHKHHHKI